jgi:hypothetical protein
VRSKAGSSTSQSSENKLEANFSFSKRGQTISINTQSKNPFAVLTAHSYSNSYKECDQLKANDTLFVSFAWGIACLI